MGLLMSAIHPLTFVALNASGASPPRPFDADLDFVVSLSTNLAELIRWLPQALVNALLGAFLFTLARLLFRRQWLALLILFPVGVVMMPTQGTYGSLPIDLCMNGLRASVWAFTLLRFGVLAASVMNWLFMYTEEAPLTLDLSAWHATPTLLLLCFVAALGAFAARHAVETRPGT